MQILECQYVPKSSNYYPRQINASLITIHTGNSKAPVNFKQQRYYLSQSLVELDKLASKFEVNIGVEVADFFSLADRFELLYELNLHKVGITLDVGHLGASKGYRDFGTISKVIHCFSDKILHFHIHDYDGERDHLVIGKGKIDFDDIIFTLKKVNYRGMLMLELNPQFISSEEEIILCRDKLREIIGK